MNGSVYLQRFDSTLNKVGSEQNVKPSDVNEQIDFNSATALDDGGFLVAYVVDNGDGEGNNAVFARQYDASASPVAVTKIATNLGENWEGFGNAPETLGYQIIESGRNEFYSIGLKTDGTKNNVVVEKFQTANPFIDVPLQNSVHENNSVSDVLLTASASDPNAEQVTFSILTGVGDADLVSIDPDSGVVTADPGLNYENDNSVEFSIVATNQTGLSDVHQAKISLIDVNEAPSISTGASGSVDENASTSTVIYDVAASDVDAGDSITFSVDGTDKDLVSIDPSSGEVTLDSSANYEVKDTYSFDVVATDDAGLTDTQPVTVSVTDVNEAPSISTGASGSVDENASTSTVIYDVAASDVDAGDSITFSVDGTDKDLVSIDPSSGEVTLDSSANYEVKDTYSFDVVATDDAGLTDTACDRQRHRCE